METALEVRTLTKRYPGFCLDRVSFSVPAGEIVGLIGENGAGKTTTIKAILGLVTADDGTVTAPGADSPRALRERIGVVFDENCFHGSLTLRQLCGVLGGIYRSWDAPQFRQLCQVLELPEGKRIGTFSRGMKQKLSLAAALAHRPMLLILDEPTSGLDPAMRETLAELLLDFVQDEHHAILFSTHLTTDLERIADRIVLLHGGRTVLDQEKDTLIYRYGVLRCRTEEFRQLDPADVLTCRQLDCQWEALVADRERMAAKYRRCVVDPVTLEDILLLYVKGGAPCGA